MKSLFPGETRGIVPTSDAREVPPFTPHLSVETNLETLAKLILEKPPTLARL